MNEYRQYAVDQALEKIANNAVDMGLDFIRRDTKSKIEAIKLTLYMARDLDEKDWGYIIEQFYQWFDEGENHD